MPNITASTTSRQATAGKKFTPSSRRNPCQLCGDTKGKCRSLPDQDLVLCMELREPPPGWRFAGETKDGLWAKFWPVDPNWKPSAEPKRWEPKPETKTIVPDSVKNREYQRILETRTLGPRHLADFTRRGLTDAEIGFLESVARSESNGYLIPFPDVNDQWCGGQVRRDHANGGRYRWYTWNENISKVNDHGELPLAVWRNGEPVWIIEGTGVKPIVASIRHSLTAIGASGGLHHISPKTLAYTLEKLGNPASVVFCPDAGDIQNRQVMRRIPRNIQALEALGVQVLIAWWDQKTKSDQDIDQLPNLDGVRFLTPKEFWSMAAGTAPDTAPQTPLEQWEASMWNGYSRRRQFTATEEINSRFLPGIPQDIDAIIKSAMQTGKTYALGSYFQVCQSGAILLGNRNSLLLQTVERVNEFNAGFTHHTDNDRTELQDSMGRVALCFDSLLKFEDEWFNDRVLVLDESVSGVKHLLLGGTLKGRRARVQAKFCEAVKRAKNVILLDGTQNNVVAEYLEALRGKPFHRLDNKFRPTLLNVKIANPEKSRDVSHTLGSAIKAATSGTGIVFASDSQRLCEAMDIALTELGVKVFRVDSKTCSDKTFKGLLSNPRLGDWIARQGFGAIVLSPSAESGLDIKPNGAFPLGFAVFYQVLDTDRQMQILRRVRDCQQWLIHCAPYSHVRADASPNERTLADQTMKAISLELAAAALDGLDLQPYLEKLEQCPHWTAKIKLEASHAWEQRHSRECLVRALQDGGHTVQICDVVEDADVRSHFKDIKKAIVKRDSRAIFQANSISADQARLIKSRFHCSLEQRWEAERALLLDRLPGIESSPLWTPETVERLLFTDRRFIGKLEKLWLIRNMEAATVRSQARTVAIVEGDTWIGDVKPATAKLKYLADLGILDLADGETVWTADDPKVQSLWNRVRRSKKAHSLGIKPGDGPLKFIGDILFNEFGCTSKRVRVGDGRGHVYALPTDALMEFVDARLTAKFQDEKLHVKNAETLTEQGAHPVQVSHLDQTEVEQVGPAEIVEPQRTGPHLEYSPEDIPHLTVVLARLEALSDPPLSIIARIRTTLDSLQSA